MKSIANQIGGDLLRDIALLLFLICVMEMVLLVAFAPVDVVNTYLLLMGVAFFAAVFAFFGRTSLGPVIAGLEVCAWTAYKLYMLNMYGSVFVVGDYFWLPAPLALVGSVCLFHYGSAKLEMENSMLRSQVEDLVMIEPLTGLFNLRALYREIPVQSRYCVRHNLDLSLMLIQLRYEQELRTFLPLQRFSELKQRMAALVDGAMRLEDRPFAIDDNGTLAILLSSNDEGCDIVKRRLRSILEGPKSFAGITDDNIMVSVRIAYRICTEEDGKRPIEFKLAVENELQYDV